MTPYENVLSRLPDHRQTSNGAEARCPAHDDRHSSLSIAEGDDGRVLVYCHAGCSTEAIVDAMGLKLRDLMPEKNQNENGKPKKAPKIGYDSLAAAVTDYGKRPNPKAVWKYPNEDGEVRFVTARWDRRDGSKVVLPFTKRKGDGKWYQEAPRGKRPLYNLLGIGGNLERMVPVNEGESCAQFLNDKGYVATTSSGGSSASGKTEWSLTKGRRITIFPDADEPGEKYLTGVLHELSKLDPPPADVKVVRLSTVVELPEGGDIVDFWEIRSEAGATDQEIAAEIKSLVKKAESVDLSNIHANEGSDDEKPIVYLNADEPEMITAAVKALADSKNIYARGGNLVHVVSDAMPPKFMRQTGSPRIKVVQKAGLREQLSATRDWQKSTEESMVSVRPPDWVVDGVLARDQWETVRPLTGIAETPVLRPDGSILQQRGYDNETGLLAHFGETLFPNIPDRPTIDDARRSLVVLMEPIADFPFASDSHRSAMVASLLIPLARHAIQEPAPLHTIDGNRRGCGKSMLADIVSVLATGRNMPRMSEPQDREEAEKRITAIAMAGELLVLIDNVAGRLGWPSLDAALTGDVWSGRLLGKSEIVVLPLVTTWFATGNNIIIGGDLMLQRRVRADENR